MLTVQTERERRWQGIDSASGVDSQLLIPEWFEQPHFPAVLKQAMREYSVGIAYPEHLDLATDAHIWTDPLLSNTSSTAWFKSGGHLEDEDVLIEEMLEPVPLEVQTMKLLVTYVGKGEPILQNDVELSLYDEER